MMIDRLPTSRRGTRRQHHVKVKSGCLTCKIRRVKCDEARPSCMRCTSTLRKCDGYSDKKPLKFINATAWAADATVSSSSQDRTLVKFAAFAPRPVLPTLSYLPKNPFLDFSGTQMEHRSLDFFRHEAAPALSGYFDAKFWSKLLPRIGQSELPVQHAMIALGSLYEFCNNEDGYPSALQQRYALIQYNKAIRALKSCRIEDPRTIEITLVTCFLFVCLDLLAGNPEQALNHLQNGLGILRNSRVSRRILSSLQPRRKAIFVNRKVSREILPDPASVIEILSDGFSRLSLQGSLCCRRLPDVYPNDSWSIIEDAQSAQVPFKDLMAARLSLSKISTQCFQPLDFLEATDSLSVRASSAKKTARDSLTEQLHHWNSRLALWVTDSLPSLAPEDFEASHVLRLLSIIAIIWNTTAHESTETAFDEHFTSHQTVVTLGLSVIQQESRSCAASSPATTATLSSTSSSEKLLAQSERYRSHSHIDTRHTSTSHKRAFTFEMGIIPALFFTALKCRCPSIRRSAIEMMRNVVPQREGMWDARMLAGVAQRAVDIEESCDMHGGETGDENGNSGSSGEPYGEEKWPREASRIHGVYITPDFELAKRWQKVVFTWRPGGPESDWATMEEDVFY